jgi:hypothetical protein
LHLAKERFGSTLTINGSADFKRLVVDAVAKEGLDIHFTDKSVNVSLAARRAELEIEKSGQSIAPATDLPRHVDDTTRASRDTSDRLGLTEPIKALHGEGQTAEQISVFLSPKLDKQMPEQERVQFVADVAKTLGIPTVTRQAATRRSLSSRHSGHRRLPKLPKPLRPRLIRPR